MATKGKKAPAKPKPPTKAEIELARQASITDKLDVHDRAIRLLITRVAVLTDKEAELRDKVAALEAEAERKKNRWFVR